MFLNLQPSCPIFRPENEIHLQELLRAVHRRWHVIVSPSPKVLAEILPSHVWVIYRDAIVNSYKLGANARTFFAPSRCGECDSGRLANYCSLPTIVVVENRHSDGKFLRLLCDALRPGLRRYLVDSLPQIDIRTAGGIGEVPKDLEAWDRDYRKVRPEGMGVSPKIIALTDGDAKRPGQMDANALAVLRCAEKLGIPCHVLDKRSIENYATDDVLLAYGNVRKDRKTAVDLILSLTPDARDHYPHKAGLEESEASANEDLYGQNVALGEGLGTGFAADWFANFQHHVTSSQLKARDGKDELIKLMDMLEDNR